MPPVRRQFGQRLKNERAQMHARMWKAQTRVVLYDHTSEGQEIEIEYPRRVRRIAYAAEVCF